MKLNILSLIFGLCFCSAQALELGAAKNAESSAPMVLQHHSMDLLQHFPEKPYPEMVDSFLSKFYFFVISHDYIRHISTQGSKLDNLLQHLKIRMEMNVDLAQQTDVKNLEDRGLIPIKKILQWCHQKLSDSLKEADTIPNLGTHLKKVIQKKAVKLSKEDQRRITRPYEVVEVIYLFLNNLNDLMQKTIQTNPQADNSYNLYTIPSLIKLASELFVLNIKNHDMHVMVGYAQELIDKQLSGYDLTSDHKKLPQSIQYLKNLQTNFKTLQSLMKQAQDYSKSSSRSLGLDTIEYKWMIEVMNHRTHRYFYELLSCIESNNLFSSEILPKTPGLPFNNPSLMSIRPTASNQNVQRILSFQFARDFRISAFCLAHIPEKTYESIVKKENKKSLTSNCLDTLNCAIYSKIKSIEANKFIAMLSSSRKEEELINFQDTVNFIQNILGGEVIERKAVHTLPKYCLTGTHIVKLPLIYVEPSADTDKLLEENSSVYIYYKILQNIVPHVACAPTTFSIACDALNHHKLSWASMEFLSDELIKRAIMPPETTEIE